MTKYYDDLIRLRDTERERKTVALEVMSEDQAPLEVTPMGIIRWYMHPTLDESVLKSYLYFVQEIPVGSRSGRIHHQGGRVHYVWQGQGHTIVDGVLHEWEEADVIALPTKPDGIEFQHFNTGDVTVKLITAEVNATHNYGVDLGAGFEVIEPAPEWVQR